MEKKYKIIALCGKSASGKDTLMKAVLKAFPGELNEIVSCTTRPPREGEVDGVNYHFLTVDQFTQKILNGEMLEATEFNDWHYGTPISSLAADKINIGVFNPDGLDILSDYDFIDLDIIYIKCSDKKRLIRQLSREENPDIDEIIRRYHTDQLDFARFEDRFCDITYWDNEDYHALSLFIDVIGQKYLSNLG